MRLPRGPGVIAFMLMIMALFLVAGPPTATLTIGPDTAVAAWIDPPDASLAPGAICDSIVKSGAAAIHLIGMTTGGIGTTHLGLQPATMTATPGTDMGPHPNLWIPTSTTKYITDRHTGPMTLPWAAKTLTAPHPLRA